VTSQTYADILKKQFSLAPDSTTTTTDNLRPPKKRQATVIDYDSDQSVEETSSNKNATTQSTGIPTNNATATNNTTTHATTTPIIATEVLSLKQELHQLKEIIAMAVTQIKEAMATLLDTKHNAAPYYATTDADQSMDTTPPHENLTRLDLQSFIMDLKHELATVFMETRAMLQQKPNAPLTAKTQPSKTWAQLWTSVGLLHYLDLER